MRLVKNLARELEKNKEQFDRELKAYVVHLFVAVRGAASYLWRCLRVCVLTVRKI
jgi:hypothetical protein